MAAAGLPVPPGFVVTTAAFEAVRDIGGIREQIDRTLALLDRGDVAALEAGAAGIRRLLEEVALPGEIDGAIRAAYRALGDDVPVAVRSSASMEDSAQTSFAGQQDTYLWIVGEDAVVEHVQRCWASVYSARSLSYRHDHADPEDDVSMAVVVQRMVDARAAGVAMTLDPLTGDRTAIVVEAAFGLGETVASGTVTPDNYVVDKVILEVTGQTIAAKEIELVADVAGRRVVQRDVEPERQLMPALDSAPGRSRWPSWPSGSSATTAVHRTSSGRWTPTARCCCCRAGRRPCGAPAPRSARTGRPGMYATGLASIANTLINPLAARSTTDVDN